MTYDNKQSKKAREDKYPKTSHSALKQFEVMSPSYIKNPKIER